MGFGAYLASSSSEGSGDEEEGPSGRGQEAAANGDDRIQKYNVLADTLCALLEGCREDKGQNGAEEDMEIRWEPGLNETTKDLLMKRIDDGGVDETTWQKYLKEKKQRRKEKKSKVKETESEEKEEDNTSVGFDDPFFQHDITTATAKSKKAKRSKLSQEELGRDRKEKSELGLLMLEDGEEESSRQHFHLPAIMKEERDSNKKQQRRLRHWKGRRGGASKEEEEEAEERDAGPRDGFQIDLTDPRFSALYELHLYAPDPANPSYRATKAMDSIMKERQKRSQHRSTSSKQKNTASESLTEPSIVSLVKSVKSKSTSFKEMQRKRKNRENSHSTLA